MSSQDQSAIAPTTAPAPSAVPRLPPHSLADSFNSLSLKATSLGGGSQFADATASSTQPLRPTTQPAAPTPHPLAGPSCQTTPRTAVLFQQACAGHRYVRNTDIGTIVERPERLRAVKTGVAAAWARLEGEKVGEERWAPMAEQPPSQDELGDLLEGLSLDAGRAAAERGKGKRRQVAGGAFDILDSIAVLPLAHPAVRLVHPSPNHAPSEAADAAWLASFASPSPAAPPSSGPPGPSTPSRQTRAVSTSPTKSSFLSTSPSKAGSTLPTPHSAPPSWPEQLQYLCRRSETAMLSQPFSEIPPHLPQGDLYLCKESEEAIFGALGAVCEGVDRVVAGTRGGQVGKEGYDRAFVGIRPPGHHCGEANPQGFCFVNNAAVAAAHAHLTHGIHRVIILDIDLHHGNGTQELVYRINAEANRILAERKSRTPAASPRKSSPRKGNVPLPPQQEPVKPLQIMYGSMHDIWSYPCEDGDASLVSAASLSLSGGHGQFLSNVHLEPWTTEEQFHAELYPIYRDGLLGKAEEFCRKTAAAGAGAQEQDGHDTLVIVSAGFDASEHESPGMSRHGRNVPTSFYRRFAHDTASFARRLCASKVLAVLEGGYSDRALASAAGAFLTGLVGHEDGADEVERKREEDGWWAEPQLRKLEKACSVAKGRRGGAGGGGSGFVRAGGGPALLVGAEARDEAWLARTVEVFAAIEDSVVAPPQGRGKASAAAAAPSQQEEEDAAKPRQLRERKVRHNYAGLDDGLGGGEGSASRPAAARRTVSGASVKVKRDPSPPPLAELPPLPPLPSAPLVPAVETTSVPASPPAPSEPGAPEPTAPPAPKQTIRFTWKQGGFMGEPRM
ncbi:hypothetical protein JCM10207_005018 [Rhodosporidiobolus poonsookiae]